MGVKKTVRTQYLGTDEHEGFEFDFNPIENTLTIEKTKKGYTARYLVQDDNPQSPEEDGDDGLFLVGYHRDFTVDRGKRVDGRWVSGIDQELAVAIAENDKENEEAQRYIKDYHIFPLEAYIHSGVKLYLSGGCSVDRQWDVSQLGLVFASKKEWRTRASARKCALGLIEDWNCYLSGDVYGCIREEYNEKKEKIDSDSCWGYTGYKYALEELKTF